MLRFVGKNRDFKEYLKREKNNISRIQGKKRSYKIVCEEERTSKIFGYTWENK